VLTRSAEINDSWRTLSDRWERARALIELSSPGAMDRGRTLDPEFLATALELAEEVAFADGPDLASLRQRLNATCDDVFAELARACAEDDFAAAARRLHESRYVRKALDWAPTPDHPLRNYFSEEQLQAHLDATLAEQQADGGWTIPWPPLSPGCEVEWRGWVTLATLRRLQANGRLLITG
jgi:hypothetical protein